MATKKTSTGSKASTSSTSANKVAVDKKAVSSKVKASATSKEKSVSQDSKSKNAASTTTTGHGEAKVSKTTTNSSLSKKNNETVELKSKEPVKKLTQEDNLNEKPETGKKSSAGTKKTAEPKAKATAKNGETTKAKAVVIPKTSTDKKVDYQPEFMKSVLDAPAVVAQGPTMRYSDSELQEFRDLIGKKLDAAKKELAYLQGLITRRDEMGGDETDNRYMTMEDGGMSMEREQLSQMASRQITFIDHLEKALMRIENKTYGICRVTGKLIDKARLRAVPHATLSMEAKLGITK